MPGGSTWRCRSCSGASPSTARDQFITRLDPDAPAGVEIRAGTLSLAADCRLDGARRTLPAVGWMHDFQSVSGQLQLPPGWRLLHASGVDQARPTWVGTWTLLDLFIVLITALATARLFGWAWGVLALAAVGLSYTESGAPTVIWLVVLAAEALVRVVPDGTARRLVQVGRVLALAALAVIAVPFLVGQVRQAMYPALEHPWAAIDAAGVRAVSGAAEPERLQALDEAAGQPAAPSAPPGEVAMKRMLRSGASYEYGAVDPHSVVQTGPGLPGWEWNAVALEWSGPVDRDQVLHLYLVSPAANLALAVLRTLLAGACSSRACSVCAATPCGVARRRRWRSRCCARAVSRRRCGPTVRPTSCSASCASACSKRLPASRRVPPLRACGSRWAPPRCARGCKSTSAAPTAVPLPGHARHWLPQSVIVDGQPAPALMQGADGALWLRLEAGTHDVLLDGPLPGRDTVQILLPLVPHRVDASVDGWTLQGVHGDGIAESSLQLTRIAPSDGERAAPLQATQLPPFARVERTLHLGLTWQIETHVVRLTPPDAALLLAVPLLPGESVTTAEVRVADGRAQINLPPQVSEATWQSALAERSPIALRAPEAVPFVEVWRLDASPIWHVEASGIAPVLRADSSAPPLREWRPWPGEAVTLAIVRPDGVPGQTLTIDQSELSVSPGLRATETSAEPRPAQQPRRAAHRHPAGGCRAAVGVDRRPYPAAAPGRPRRRPAARSRCATRRAALARAERRSRRAFTRRRSISARRASTAT